MSVITRIASMLAAAASILLGFSSTANAADSDNPSPGRPMGGLQGPISFGSGGTQFVQLPGMNISVCDIIFISYVQKY